MMDTPPASQQDSPLWFYRFFQGYAFYALILLGLLYADFFAHPLALDPIYDSILYRLLVALAIVPAGLAISVLILRRTHYNVIGLFLLIYAAEVMQGTLRVDSSLQVLNNVIGNAYIGLWLLPLYFPDGRVYPLRFQKWIRLHTLITSILFAGVVLFQPDLTINLAHGQTFDAANPLMIHLPRLVREVITTAQALTWLSTVILIIPSIFLRLRASQGVVRQQIKVFVWTFAILIGLFLAGLPFFSLHSVADQASQLGSLAPVLFLYSGILLPAAPFAVVGYAILRHKLYDIDIIIRRTLQYGAITALLALVYFGGVALFQSLFSVITGEKSPLAVVISTLAIAALFTPLRKRVQVFVDRRFYRQKYDIERTLEQFSEKMRDEVDASAFREELIQVVTKTMHPQYVTLWVPLSDRTED